MSVASRSARDNDRIVMTAGCRWLLRPLAWTAAALGISSWQLGMKFYDAYSMGDAYWGWVGAAVPCALGALACGLAVEGGKPGPLPIGVYAFSRIAIAVAASALIYVAVAAWYTERMPPPETAVQHATRANPTLGRREGVRLVGQPGACSSSSA